MRIVIKVGGNLFSPEYRSQAEAIAADVRSLIDAGHQVLLIHGGGRQTTALQEALGQTPHIVAGRRITDEPALEAIKMVVGGKINLEFCSILRARGVNAVGLNGVSGHVIQAEKRPPRVVTGGGDAPIDFGHVGDVTGVNDQLISLLLDHGYTPVLACIGSDPKGRPYNINADAVANDVAVAAKADRLVLVTDAPGVLRDIEDPSSRVPILTEAASKEAIADRVIQRGMIPKVEEAFQAIARGLQHVHIVGDLVPGTIVDELEQPGARGTALSR